MRLILEMIHGLKMEDNDAVIEGLLFYPHDQCVMGCGDWDLMAEE